MATDELSRREKLRGLYLIATYRPAVTLGIVVCSAVAALLAGIGATFIVPLIELAQADSPAAAEGGRIVAAFVTVYDALGVPFTIGTVVLGVSLAMTVRFLSSIAVAWMRVWLQTTYVRELQAKAFENALDAHVSYFDREGSDDILNAIVTQAEYAGKVIRDFVRVFEQGILIVMYLGLAFYLAPMLTIVAGGIIGGLTFLVRNVFESGYAVGDRVADANEKIQQSAQAGTQGIRDVKMTGIRDELYDGFSRNLDQFTDARIKLGRNEAMINNVYNLSIAVLLFVLIYAALSFAEMSLGALAAFLFVMFQTGPRVSQTNEFFYKLEGRMPHLIRTQQFIGELEANRDLEGGDRPVPEEPTPIAFDEVSFAYEADERILDDVSFRVDDGEFVAFVGQSGAGKSTIAALLARLYAPDDGEITAAGEPIDEFDVAEWRSRIAFVRQDPYIFNDTLLENVTIGNRDASMDEVEEACRIAQVAEFVDDLPEGYETELGDDGVRLSGGQRQRVALARALLEDADILILDEATSDLDATIESEVQEGLEALGRDYTIVAIAHRLSTVRDADTIYTLEDGHIIERGEHGQLLEADGAYADLYAAQ
ncbi:ABC transporter ATP-binding protein [Haloterrigena alkaliphila]|uniref:ABC transporter ATP-binding protein n=1 Tax=Haloterrigena alkaliphila TaxID=2816475 RepID=A0A8A2VC54_9EURY|nr:ABC transporter ATP-binding protein [Haloterrigena alkaliphila]QSW98300.1 ABC transporter ATP-binding protein/permease [Haloterrigena alkaliphila]